MGNINWGILLFCSSFLDYHLGKVIYHSKNRQIKKLCLIVSVIINLSFLSFFKYWDWVIGSVLKFESLKHDIPIPAGISFYTFQSMSYIIDVYRGQFKAKCKIWEYLSFVSFFPQLVAGPIERAPHLLHQLTAKKIFVSKKSIDFALFQIIFGLTKKIVFADNLGNIVDRCLENLNQPGMGLILLFSFTFQIYCDFSGYTDIARGVARLFGINLMRNFLTPYYSLNPSEFWRRWHISLSSWVKDYIYISLGGNRGSNTRNIINLIITMFLMGLWHGTGGGFILWGIFHGIILSIHRITKWDIKFKEKFGNKLGNLINRIIMILIILFGWLLFFSKSMKQFKNIFYSTIKLFNFKNLDMFLDFSYGSLLFIFPIIILDYFAYRKNREYVDFYKIFNTKTRTILILILTYLIIFFASRSNYGFIYFVF
ncbi:MAG: MBOAT family protein [Sphingobacteriia bacterium]|nr:MBOAT family protein [Sphingobacteriia bacterium]